MEENAEPYEPMEEPGATETPVSAMMEGMGQGERLLGLGAVIVVLNYILFEVIVEEYFFSTTLLSWLE